jgi:plastocyanin
MRGIRRAGAVLGVLTAVAVAAVVASGGGDDSQAAVEKRTFKGGKVTVSGYHGINETRFDIPRPEVDGFVTSMDARLVDEEGRPIPQQELMMHHLTFGRFGAREGACDEYTLFDSKTKVPALTERFWGTGEELNRLILPAGYGYPIAAADDWYVNYMVMNHTGRTLSGYIEYTVTYEKGGELTPVKPYWLDVEPCLADPVYSVPGGGRPGSTHSRHIDWEVPRDARIVGFGGHLHGGGKQVVLSQPECEERVVFRSNPTWAPEQSETYQTKPILHEPGPIDMTVLLTREGVPVARGEKLRLTALYDNEKPHMRVMGIGMLYMAHEDVPGRCGPLPDDAEIVRRHRGRTKPPLLDLPLVAPGRGAQARAIDRPPGRTLALDDGDTVRIGDLFFEPANSTIEQGSSLRWRFGPRTLHNVTLVDGPKGFASPNLSEGRSSAHRFDRPGTYKLQCTLHPAYMSATVRVSPRAATSGDRAEAGRR